MFVDLGCFSLILFSGKKFGINRFRWGDILYIMFAYLIIYIDFIRYYNKIGTEKPLILNTSQANCK